jgi:hypothetical protein
MKINAAMISIVLLALMLGGCAPEVGSRQWCEQMADKPNGDWTINEAKDYARHCVFENYSDEQD